MLGMLIVFDMDGTLIEGNSWSRLNKFFNVENKALTYMKDYINGNIKYCDFMKRVINLWGENIHIKTIKSILLNYKLSPGAFEVIQELHKRGFITAIITVGLDILANDVARNLNISYVLANGLEINIEGYLTGNSICRVELLRKDKALKVLAEHLNIPLDRTIAVGDSKYDISMLKIAGLGIAYNADPELIREADISITDLREILKYVW